MNPKPIAADPLKLHRVIFFVLIFSMFLAFLKPAVMFLSGNEDKGTQFKINYGIPTTWYKPTDTIPPTVVPPNSIGLDFICPYVHIHCGGGPGNLEVYTKDCGNDPFQRFYPYPPLMTFLLSIFASFPIGQAIALWTLCTLAVIFASTYFWLSFSPEKQKMFTAFLFTLSYPALFEFERANNDIVVLLLVSVCAYLWLRKHWFFLGSTLSITALFKMYPASLSFSFILLSLFLVADGSFQKKPDLKKAGLMLLAGQAAGAAAVLVPLFKLYHYYVTQNIPQFMRYLSDSDHASAINHSLTWAYGQSGTWFGRILWALGTLSLVLSTRRWLAGQISHKKALLAFTYLCALTTYLIPAESKDYNLITLIPFFCFAGGLVFQKHHFIAASGLFLWALGYSLPRWLSDILPRALTTSFSPFLLLECAGIILMTLMLFIPLRSDD